MRSKGSFCIPTVDQGNRTGTIAKILNEKQIPTPAAYHVAENHVYSEQKAWDVLEILHERERKVYCNHAVCCGASHVL